jgi:hypothetical protein
MPKSKYFLVEDREKGYRNYYEAYSWEDAKFVAQYDTNSLALDVTEVDRDAIPKDAPIYPAMDRDRLFVLHRTTGILRKEDNQEGHCE